MHGMVDDVTIGVTIGVATAGVGDLDLRLARQLIPEL